MGISQNEGRRNGAESLCETCIYGLVLRGKAESEQLMLCTHCTPVLRVPFPVRECSEYSDRGVPSLYSMEKIAMILLQEASARKMGFVTLEQFRNLVGEDAEVLPLSSVPRRR